MALTSGHRVDAVEPICLATKAQPPNPMKVEAVLGSGPINFIEAFKPL